MNSKLGGSLLFLLGAIHEPLKLAINSVMGASKTLIYFLSMLVVVRVYNATGAFQASFPAMREESHALEPL